MRIMWIRRSIIVFFDWFHADPQERTSAAAPKNGRQMNLVFFPGGAFLKLEALHRNQVPRLPSGAMEAPTAVINPSHLGFLVTGGSLDRLGPPRRDLSALETQIGNQDRHIQSTAEHFPSFLPRSSLVRTVHGLQALPYRKNGAETVKDPHRFKKRNAQISWTGRLETSSRTFSARAVDR